MENDTNLQMSVCFIPYYYSSWIPTLLTEVYFRVKCVISCRLRKASHPSHTSLSISQINTFMSCCSDQPGFAHTCANKKKTLYNIIYKCSRQLDLRIFFEYKHKDKTLSIDLEYGLYFLQVFIIFVAFIFCCVTGCGWKRGDTGNLKLYWSIKRKFYFYLSCPRDGSECRIRGITGLLHSLFCDVFPSTAVSVFLHFLEWRLTELISKVENAYTARF